MDAPDLPAPLNEDAARHVEHTAMAEVASGSSTAFAQVYDLTSGTVFGLLLTLVDDRADAESLLQDTYLELWQRAGDFAVTAGDLDAWICTIAHRKAVDHLRATGRSSRGIESAVGMDPLLSIPASESECIALAYYAGLTQQDIASRTGHPLATVRTRTRAGLSRLRDRAAEVGPSAIPTVPA